MQGLVVVFATASLSAFFLFTIDKIRLYGIIDVQNTNKEKKL